LKNDIKWELGILSWNDFTEIDSLSGGYDANIFSEIALKGDYTKDNFEVYAYMNPNQSHKVKDSSFNKQLLIHETYHFNITEYHARLLRKEIIKLGIQKLTKEKIDSLHNKYKYVSLKMQKKYDEESDHNKKQRQQRYWEMKIDDLLRQTEIYKNSNLNSYSKYKNQKTEYFKKVFLTLNNDLLSYYPVNKSMIGFGKTYQVSRYKDSIIINHFQNGILTNGGEFNSAIFKILYTSDSVIEKHSLNPNRTYNLSQPYQISKNIKTKNKELIVQYFNEKKERITYKNIYQKIRKHLSNEKVISTFYDKKGNGIYQSEGVYQERKTLDSIGRVTLIESLGKDGLYCLDKSDLSSTIKYSYDKNHNLKQRTYYNFYGKHAKHINQYNLFYKYDDLGNTNVVIVLNEENKKVEDQNGVCIYKYWFDLRDNNIQTKRYNRKINPILGSDDFFKSVTDYDDQNRVSFEAKYYFLNRLKYNDNDKWGATKYEYLGDSIELRYNLDVYNEHFNDDTKIATVKNYFNKKGYTKKIQYLDVKGNFAKTDDNIVQYTYKYDASGNNIEETTLDSLGKKIVFSEDVATVKWEYDKNNSKIKTTYYTKDGNLANAKQGATYNFFITNKRNNEVKYFNKEMKPVEIDGIHRTKYEANRFGKDSIISYYNKNNSLIDGVAIIKYKYNLFSSLIQESYFNNKKKLTKDSNGISYKRYLMNDQQQNTGYKFFDKNFTRTNNKFGYHYEKITLDNYNFRIGYEYFDKRKRPVFNSEKYHKTVYQRDSLGELINYKQFGLYNNLVEDKIGIAEIRYKMTTAGLVKSIKNYNRKGNLTNDEDGVAETYYKSYLHGLYYIDKQLDKDGNEIKNNQ
jgi:YD repeat-containing protein